MPPPGSATVELAIARCHNVARSRRFPAAGACQIGALRRFTMHDSCRNSMPEEQRRFAVEVVRRLRGAGFEAYWAGGCVRDQLLGRTPKDYDVATNAMPDRSARCSAAAARWPSAPPSA